MHYDDVVYRPPYEARSLLLQVTRGCSHNACTFCSMYAGVAYRESPLDEVAADVAEAREVAPLARRVFLVAGDAFSRSADDLLAVAGLVHAGLPRVSSIGSYARVTSVATKTDAELRRLADAGLADINIGVESALDDVLALMNKGYDADEAARQLRRLDEAGITYNLNIIIGAAGPARLREHARANAALVRAAHPTLVCVSPLHVDPAPPLERMVADGAFRECTVGQYIEEERAFLSDLRVEDCVFFGAHVSNPVPVVGMLGKDREALLAALDEGRRSLDPALLSSRPSKGAEGRILG